MADFMSLSQQKTFLSEEQYTGKNVESPRNDETENEMF